MEDEKVSFRHFGRIVGQSDTHVRRQLRNANNPDGILTNKAQTINDANGRPMLFVKQALKEWVGGGFEINGTGYEAEEAPAEKPVKTKPEPTEIKTPAAKPATVPNAQEETVGADLTALKAKRMQAVYMAKLKELEYKQKSGELVSKADMYKAWFEFGQQFYTAFEQLIQSAAPLIASQKGDIHFTQNLLRERYAATMEKFSTGIKDVQL